MKKIFAMMMAAALAMAATVARAGDDWSLVAELQVAGSKDPKEVKVDRKVARARITCTEGLVVINGFVIRQGGQKDYRKVGTRIAKDEVIELDIVDGKDNKKVLVEGFRISDDGRGRYKVEVLH